MESDTRLLGLLALEIAERLEVHETALDE
jgi:hypothetical protein